MARIKNPNTTGRVAVGVGEVGPGQVSEEIDAALAAALADGDNFVLVDAPKAASDDGGTRKHRPQTPPNDD